MLHELYELDRTLLLVPFPGCSNVGTVTRASRSPPRGQVWTVASVVGMEFLRAVFVRVMNNCWCWDLERTAPKYADFSIAENILHLVNNQGMVW